MRDLKILTRKLRRVFRPSHHDDPIVLQDRYRSALTHVAEFFERIDEENIAKQFLDLADAMEGRACARSPRSLLADQQDKSSNSYKRPPAAWWTGGIAAGDPGGFGTGEEFLHRPPIASRIVEVGFNKGTAKPAVTAGRRSKSPSGRETR
jgi:hypothetical protein